jgi:hypothetical protein
MRQAEELVCRDFSNLFLVKENRRQPENSACCISFTRVSLTSRVFAMDERKWGAMLNLESGGRIELFYKGFPKAPIRATVNRLLNDRDEGMGLV